ncbi:MAG TPA: ABC transporter permease [Phycisphaerae bacterium]|mgnify:CR=1 FL=1|nr:ABC transporter permease [Phycisphaerae bacterium]
MNVRSLPTAQRDVLFALLGLLLVAVVGCVFNADGVFFRAGTHADTLWQNGAYGILACGMTVVIIVGGIDLAVGSVVALSGVVFATLVMKHGAAGAWAIPAAVVVGGLTGVVSGWLVAFVRVQPFIATLAMMAFARGLAKHLAGGQVITRYPYPDLIEALNTSFDLAGFKLSIHVVVFLACALLTLFLLRATAHGVHIYAVGDNETAARYAGLPVRRIKVAAYALCGAFAGLAGVLFCALERQGNPDGGVGFELTAIAMVVVGGTPLTGGRGGIVLTVLGTLTIGYLRKILDINAVETAMQLMITGGIIILAVLAQGLRPRPT